MLLFPHEILQRLHLVMWPPMLDLNHPAGQAPLNIPGDLSLHSNRVARARDGNRQEYHVNMVWPLFGTWEGITRIWAFQKPLCIHATSCQPGNRCTP
uniref:Uncharacterized protein n=1 Tax=Lactuca sativa TaxID=4236 RepID=A0A9R1XDB4_LACSA|nr:hypothetical protein LSAT_V11C500228990 [Lactuca sativa]